MVDDMRFNYSDLNPDLIMDAIDLSGLRIDSGLIELNSYENRVYQFQDEVGIEVGIVETHVIHHEKGALLRPILSEIADQCRP